LRRTSERIPTPTPQDAVKRGVEPLARGTAGATKH
jgi:hypothetical protein